MEGSAAKPSLAERQLAAARRDPRLDVGPEAMVANWRGAMHAAEQARSTATFGIHEMAGSLKNQERSVGHRHGEDGIGADDAADLEAAWDRAELAKAAIDSEFAELNAMTLIAMLSAVDGLVEAFVPGIQEMLADRQVDLMIEEVEETLPKSVLDALSEEQRAAVKRTFVEMLLERQPPLKPLKGAGTKRWEPLLAQAGFAAPDDRPLPSDLDDALTEIVAVRHVLVHRLARVDRRALRMAPTLTCKEGDLIRLGQQDYRRYSAALWTYSEEVVRRVYLDLVPPVNLVDWRENYTLGP